MSDTSCAQFLSGVYSIIPSLFIYELRFGSPLVCSDSSSYTSLTRLVISLLGGGDANVLVLVEESVEF